MTGAGGDLAETECRLEPVVEDDVDETHCCFHRESHRVKSCSWPWQQWMTSRLQQLQNFWILGPLLLTCDCREYPCHHSLVLESTLTHAWTPSRHQSELLSAMFHIYLQLSSDSSRPTVPLCRVYPCLLYFSLVCLLPLLDFCSFHQTVSLDSWREPLDLLPRQLAARRLTWTSSSPQLDQGGPAGHDGCCWPWGGAWHRYSTGRREGVIARRSDLVVNLL